MTPHPPAPTRTEAREHRLLLAVWTTALVASAAVMVLVVSLVRAVVS